MASTSRPRTRSARAAAATREPAGQEAADQQPVQQAAAEHEAPGTPPLERFSPATQAWFRGAFAAPTAAQEGAWDAVSTGRDALVVAPTGSGKTLAAFLWSLDRIASAPTPEEPLQRCRVLYISPLKALAVDVERNLRAPLTGIRQASARLGLPEPEVTVGVRSGDTPADERRTFGRRPPDILITTPESLFLILTSRAREALAGVETVILDEVHAVAGTKRGAHLALSLERLDALLERPAQRIGLSATVRPVEEVARFLSGTRTPVVVRPPSTKQIEVEVVVPVDDMAELGAPTGELNGSAAGGERRASIWPHVEERIVDLVEANRSTIVFANSRRLAERLTARLNEIANERATGEDLAEPGTLTPAQLMAQAGAAHGAPTELARAHHGSVSREQRTLTEEALKAGRLPAVVATSSLELGIDMGAVDLVVQVESPPSVASGLQRVGRAGHQVGAVSRGVIFPKYRGDLLQTAVVAERMRSGAIEALRIPRNPLDVLAQQVVAMCALDSWDVDELLELVRRAAPFAELPRSAYESVLDMLSGRYPSDEFAELRPRLVWDRTAGTLSGRPGAQRLAVTSGGTIPDRGLFGVFLAAGEGPARRVGELDEEMVYESRVGDVFTLGSSSWRIEDITHDRVLVSPAPGQPGKLPFWHGDSLGRPVELGRALGEFVREVGRLPAPEALERVRAAGLDERAASNLLAYLDEQRAATGVVPDDRTIVVERFRDELGDWRVCVHSPFGAQVHAPWALALSARLRERTGLDVQIMHADDGIVLRLPDLDLVPVGDLFADDGGQAQRDPAAGAAAGAEAAVLDPDEVEPLVTGEVGASALFASRFRECAARALLLPRRDPGRRTPLWAQRQRSAQLLSVAAGYGSFPIVLETVRECLQDVFDVPGLVALMRSIESREVRVVEVETPAPSPFARSLLFGYVAQYIYEGDSPLAERRAQALSLDPALLAELLGQAELRELLEPAVVERLDLELQRLAEDRKVRDLEGTADLLRLLGPLTTAEAVERGAQPAWLVELEGQRRVIRVRIAGEERWAGIEDAGRLRDALGAALPVGVPEAFLEPVRDPLGDLVARYARTHGPFAAADTATRFGLGPAVVHDALRRLAAAGRVVEGEFRPGAAGVEWCDAEVLRTLRRRSLAALRKEVEPVPARALARFLPVWQGVGSNARGVDGLLRALEQLQGAAVPASALETLVLPLRVPGYYPALLDELCASGEVVWSGQGALAGGDGWLSLHLADSAPLTLAPPVAAAVSSPVHEALLDALARGGGWFFRQLSDTVGAAVGPVDDPVLVAALWDLAWGGHITNDTLAPVRAVLGGSGRSRRAAAPRSTRPRPGRPGRPVLGSGAALLGSGGPSAGSLSGAGARRPALPSRLGPPSAAGRWAALPAVEPDPTRRASAAAEALLERHGVLTRGAVVAERSEGGFAAAYRVLSVFEETGRVRRGYFVEGLGAAQFASPGAVDRLRALQTAAERSEQAPEWAPGDEITRVPDWAAGGVRRPVRQGPGAVVMAAADPANAYGAALPWPVRPGDTAAGHKPGRKAGAVVVLVDGELVLYVERGGKSLLSWTEDLALLQPATDALALAVRDGALGRLTVEKADGAPLLGGPLAPVAEALASAGFIATPRGLRMRA
ncbi:ATP-dependent Lhr-like helicase [Motilibacter peucedani]|uniref:ATP-dependent Lhr-like helicase n=1 Tax=Motilibacter peucedani TaxID=598650 RepID=A0A420XRJ6_9ACTN|nr:ATP-dependent helicase [Motilibacter peucedani]RKS77427.1 ATP-dependent Lhr-like helicase [Motilibacter peucedani]